MAQCLFPPEKSHKSSTQVPKPTITSDIKKIQHEPAVYLSKCVEYIYIYCTYVCVEQPTAIFRGQGLVPLRHVLQNKGCTPIKGNTFAFIAEDAPSVPLVDIIDQKPDDC